MSDEREPNRGEDAPSEGDADRLYGAYYYEHCCGLPYGRSEGWLGLFGRFADRIASEIRPESVLDAGCAMGLLVEALRDRDVDAYGLDISSYAIAQAHPSVEGRCRVGSVLEPFGRRYDLIVTIEVLEHLAPRDAEAAVANLCAHADDIVFSSTPFDYKEASHFNVQPPEYWAELFARHGFHRDLDYDASYITRWAARFRKGDPSPARLVLGYERKLWRLSQENLGARESLMEHQDALIRSEANLAEARARLAPAESVARESDARMAERYAAEAALAAEFHRAVGAWSSHVSGLDEQIRRSARDQEAMTARIREQDARLAEAERRAAFEAVAARQERDELQNQLDRIVASRAWRLASTLARLKDGIVPDGSRRKRALRAMADWTRKRRDRPHAAAPSPTRRQGSKV